MDFIRYNITSAEPVTESKYLKRMTNCNGFTIINTGAVIARINGQILYPGTPGTSNGDSITIGGNAGEIFLGNVQVIFDAGAGAEVMVTQKYYILDKPIV
jgi:hypothetical protein